METGLGLALAIYFVDILHTLDDGGVLFITIAGGLIISLLLCGINWEHLRHREDTTNRQDERDNADYIKKTAKNFILINSIAILLVFLAPDKETSYTMLAAYGLGSVYDTVSENEDVQRIASKSLQMVESHIDSYLNKAEEKETTNE